MICCDCKFIKFSSEYFQDFKERLDEVVQKYDISLVKKANRIRPAAAKRTRNPKVSSLMPVVRLDRIKIFADDGEVSMVEQTDESKVTAHAHPCNRSTRLNQLEQKKIHDLSNSESSTEKTSKAQSSEKEPTSKRPFRKCRKRTSYVRVL